MADDGRGLLERPSISGMVAPGAVAGQLMMRRRVRMCEPENL